MMALHIVHGIGVGLLIAAGGTSIGIIAASIVPQWPRILRLALGEIVPTPPAPRVSNRISHPAGSAATRAPIQKRNLPMSNRRPSTEAPRS